jgi:desulfoferrodoxin (superoxide reductase-like protein)
MKKNIFILFLISTILFIPTISVYANIPSVISITRRNEGSNTIIDVKVNHADPSTTHYIAQINLDLDGTVKTFTDLTHATTTEVTYSLNIGSATPKTIKAQAVCVIHGPGAYFTEGGTAGTTSGGGVPAYPRESIFVGVLLGFAVLVIVSKRR